MGKNKIISVILLLLMQSIYSSTYYKEVLNNPKQEKKLEAFLQYIFTPFPHKAYLKLIKEETLKNDNDEATFQSLKTKLANITPSYFSKMKEIIRSLTVQKEVIARQTAQFIKNKPIKGYLEIGSPGRYIKTLKKYISLSGPCFVMPFQKQSKDIIENGSFLYPGKVLHFNYNDLPIEPNSLDLISCFVGLHHAPTERLDAFIASIYKTLTPGGMFLLRDHNASKENKTFLHVVHSVYNVGTDVSLKNEKEEIRNFQSLDYWIKTIEKHGFKISTTRLLQKNDPTENTLLCFTKPKTNNDTQLATIDSKLLKTSHYLRPGYQSFLTAPEWYSVNIIKDYGSFLEHTPWFDYPYTKSIRSFWNVWKKATYTNYKKHGALSSFFSSYTLMNAFVGAVITGIFTQLNVLAIGPRTFYHLPGNEEPRSIQILINDPLHLAEKIDPRIIIKKEFSSFRLIEIPRYNPFTRIIELLAKEQHINILRVAGQKELQLKIKLHKNENYNACLADGEEFLYEYESIVEENYKEAYINVQLSALPTTLKKITEQKLQLLQIVDY